MKRVIIILLVFTLISCVRLPSTENESIVDIFQNMTINLDYIFVNRVYEVDGETVDHIEIFDQSNKSAILIHVMVNTELENLQKDYMVLITPVYVYSTLDMSQTTHDLDIQNITQLQFLINQYTELIDLSKFTNHQLTQEALKLQDRSFNRHSGLMFYSGETTKEAGLPANAKSTLEIVYKDSTLLEIHYRNVYRFDSTKQESNYINGIHYYFSNQLDITFPPIASFSPKN